MSRDNFNPIKNFYKLPMELKKQLNLASNEERAILEIFKKGGGTLNISEVLVGYYKIYGETKSRKYVITTLYRMAKKQLLESTEKKGEYSINTGL